MLKGKRQENNAGVQVVSGLLQQDLGGVVGGGTESLPLHLPPVSFTPHSCTLPTPSGVSTQPSLGRGPWVPLTGEELAGPLLRPPVPKLNGHKAPSLHLPPTGSLSISRLPGLLLYHTLLHCIHPDKLIFFGYFPVPPCIIN